MAACLESTPTLSVGVHVQGAAESKFHVSSEHMVSVASLENALVALDD